MNAILDNVEKEMQKSLDSLDHQYARIGAGRANPAILSSVRVDYYGSPTPIEQMASVSVSESRTIIIEPWDKSILGDLEKAIHAADLGISPANDGSAIRLNFPQPTEERRKEIVRDVKAIAEDCKVIVRNVRRDAKNKLEQEDLPEDDARRAEDKIQKITDKYTEKIDSIATAKEKEVLEI